MGQVDAAEGDLIGVGSFVGEGGLDIGAAEAYLDTLVSETERRREEEIVAMRARGEEPGPRDGLVRLGLPLIWASLRWDAPGIAEVRLGFQDDLGEGIYAWGDAWPRRGALVPAEILLGQLLASWPSLARRYLSGETSVSDVAMASGSGGLPFEFLASDGEGLRLEARDRFRRFGAESVLVVEVLAGLADLLAGGIGADHPAARGWSDLRSVTDLPPMEIEGDGPGSRDPFNEQTAWYAGHLGVAVMPYSLAAVRVQARQILHGMRGTEEPTREEWDPASLPQDLGPDTVMTLASEAAETQGCSVQEFIRGAVDVRNMDARQRILYGRGAGTAQAA